MTFVACEPVALIIGAGPAGLAAARELLKHTGIKPVVLEGSGDVGGIFKTVVHHGNRRTSATTASFPGRTG